MKILLGMDDSKYSRAALNTIVDDYVPEKTEVLVLHVLEPLPYFLTPEIAPRHPAELGELLAKARQTAEKLVAGAIDKLKAAGFQAGSRIQEGDPKSVILETAGSWSADLIVLGSHGRRGLEHFLMGSVSDAVARHANCSVQVVRLKKAAPAGPL